MSESEDDHIIFICSDQSITYYPENKPFHFKVNLTDSIYLEGEKWEMAMMDFYTPALMNKKGQRELYIFCDLCMGVNVFHHQFSLLRRIFPTTSNNWNNIFSNPLYLPVKKSDIQDIEINILSESGEEASFLNQRLSFTLHIRKKQRKLTTTT